MLKNPTAEFIVQACLSGERATSPKLARIRNHVAMELALDAAKESTFSISKVLETGLHTRIHRLAISDSEYEADISHRRIKALRYLLYLDLTRLHSLYST
jgi:TAG lipase/steryl ester hydrolase/phospholipase A2/LPA acyltransferase